MRNGICSFCAALFASALTLASCSKQNPPAASGEPLIISVAASTQDLVDALAKEFSAEGKIQIKVNPGPSNGLATQILEGAPADLFLSASPQWAEEVRKGGQAEEMKNLLTNRLVMVVPKDNPGHVREPIDLLSPSVKKVALAGENVPAGMYADQALTKLELQKKLTDEGKIVRGQDVRTALAYVERGEAEAGIIYSTDAKASNQAQSVYEFDPASHDKIVYVLVLLKHGAQKPAARQFYEFLASPKPDDVYSKFGFTRLN